MRAATYNAASAMRRLLRRVRSWRSYTATQAPERRRRSVTGARAHMSLDIVTKTPAMPRCSTCPSRIEPPRRMVHVPPAAM